MFSHVGWRFSERCSPSPLSRLHPGIRLPPDPGESLHQLSCDPQHLLAPGSYVCGSAKLVPLIAPGGAGKGGGGDNSAAFDALIPSLNRELTLNKHVDSFQTRLCRDLGANSARLALIRHFQVYVFLSRKKTGYSEVIMVWRRRQRLSQRKDGQEIIGGFCPLALIQHI